MSCNIAGNVTGDLVIILHDPFYKSYVLTFIIRCKKGEMRVIGITSAGGQTTFICPNTR